MKVLVTGVAGFIGFHLAKHLLDEGIEIVGLDNINSYYDPSLKFARLNELGIETSDVEWGKICNSNKHSRFRFIRLNLEDREDLNILFEKESFDIVCHLAAQAGVRYSIENPYTYIDSNIVGFINILEACRNFPVDHLLYASSSSVYGNNKKVPFSERDNVDHPISLYAATKKANELMAETYSHLYNINITGLRFFTVYGPWGRPDMAYFKFANAILRGDKIDVYNYGDLKRDFTFIDDIVDGIYKLILKKEFGNKCKVYNIGNNKPVTLMEFINTLEDALGKNAEYNFLPMQPGDVYETYADISKIKAEVSFCANTPIKLGLESFVEWFKSYKFLEVS